MGPENSWREKMAAELRELESRDQLRSLTAVGGINLCSNDYLGLSANPALRAAALEAVAKCDRLGSTGSRLLSGHAREWEELEEQFADFAGTGAALYFTSGYAANLGLLTALLSRDDIVFSDELNHASLIDGIRLSGAERIIYPHCDLDFLETALRSHESSAVRKLIVTESVFSMDGDEAPLAGIYALARRYGAEIVVDEAHATGVFGPQGRGRVAELGFERRTLAIVHTCGKALASAGAFVCGSATLKQFLINRARTMLFSTALPPYMAGQIGAALTLARDADAEREQLAGMAGSLRGWLRSAGFDIGRSESQIVPILLGENVRALEYAESLEKSGFAVRAIRPPTVSAGSARLRLSFTCALRMEDVSMLYAALVAIRTRERVMTAAAG